jgi:hypothetical protein
LPCSETCRGWIVHDAPSARYKGDGVVDTGDILILPVKYRKHFIYEPDLTESIKTSIYKMQYSDGFVFLDDTEQYLLTTKDEWLQGEGDGQTWRAYGTIIFQYPKYGAPIGFSPLGRFYWGCVASLGRAEEPWEVTE